MPLSPYIARVRERIGKDLLLMPGVAALIEDPERPDHYLTHLREDGMGWSLPAGTIEPGESPAEAVCREVLEETGLLVEPVEVRGVLGAERGTVRYPNGDLVEHTTIVFSCRVVGGELSCAGDETRALAFVELERLLAGEFTFPAGLFGPGCYFAQPPTVASGEDFIQQFHTRHAGRTFDSFGWGRLGGTDQSSYDTLVASATELPTGAHLLDLACGDGVLLAEIASRRPDLELTGVDLNAAELELARGRRIPNARFLRADARRLPLDDGSVDQVTCHMSFMLFDDPEAVVGELGRVTRPGAVVDLVVGDGSSPSGARRVFVDLLRRYDVAMPRLGTRRARSAEGLKELFTTSKFETAEEPRQLELVLDGPVDQVWTSLSLMYNFEPLGAEQRAEVESEFRQHFGGEETIAYRISMLHARFARTGSGLRMGPRA